MPNMSRISLTHKQLLELMLFIFNIIWVALHSLMLLQPRVMLSSVKAADIAITKSIFIKENKGEFKMFYKLGPQLGSGITSY